MKTFQEQAFEYTSKLKDLAKKFDKPIFIWMYIQWEKEQMKWTDYCSYTTSDMCYYDNIWALAQINKMVVDDNSQPIDQKQPWEK